MLVVLLLALASSACAAASTVCKHRSAQADAPGRWSTPLPEPIARLVAHPAFVAALVFDVGAVGFQIWALRLGELSVVQPVLSAALILSLALTHAINRTRPSASELALGALLVFGLVLFLVTSGATGPDTAVSIGAFKPGLVLAGLSISLISVALFGTRNMRPSARARVLAIAVAGIYATTAALMKSVGHIAGLHGRWAALGSWQLWVLLALAALGLVLNQVAFAEAPLRVTLPIIGSLDPLFSIVIGMCVYREVLRHTPTAILGEVVGLTCLVIAVIGLSRQSIAPDPESEPADEVAEKAT